MRYMYVLDSRTCPCQVRRDNDNETFDAVPMLVLTDYCLKNLEYLFLWLFARTTSSSSTRALHFCPQICTASTAFVLALAANALKS